MEPRVRICDIAEELGLSTATVSNVLHGKTKKISDETVRRVLALVEARNYIPAMAGILLAQNNSKIIGVFVNDHEKYEGHTLDDVFIASCLNALSVQIEAQERFMMVKTARQPEQILRFASMWNMDGVIIIGFCHQDYLYLRNHMRIPFVVYDGFCEHSERFANITIDNFDGGRQVGQLFRAQGHRRALCISDNEVGVDKARIDGFLCAFGEAQTLQIPLHRAERMAFYHSILPRLRSVTAIFAVSDFYAIELIRFLQENGLRVPQDLFVAGFDDIPLCPLVYPSLTTVRQDSTQRAVLALSLLARMRCGEDVAPQHMLPVQLIERESTYAL